MSEHYLEIPKTARYSTLGALNKEIKKVWIVCHGYGYLSNRFIRSFARINTNQVLVVAPEGLHRYYLNGFSGKVGASWMTKEDRLNDIKDYVVFLDSLYNHLFSIMCRENVTLNVLGFSQGTATACRWLCQGKAKADNLVLWGGPVPEDISVKSDVSIMNRLNLQMVIGDKDEFISEENLQDHLTFLDEALIKYKLVRYSGNHNIDPETLASLNL